MDVAALALSALHRRAARPSGPELRARAAQLTTLRAALDAQGKRFEGVDLEDVLPALVKYLATEALRGWLFTASVATEPLPYVVTRFDYVPASNDEAGKILIELRANAKGTLQTNLLRIMAPEVAGSTISEILGLVNDEAVLSARNLTLEAPGDVLGHFLRKAGKSNNFSGEDEIAEIRAQIPVHPYILMFHLDLHHHG